jgi:hypothetical protein
MKGMNMTIGAKTPELRSLADLRFYEAGSTVLGNKPLSGSSSVAFKWDYLDLSQLHFNRAVDIIADKTGIYGVWFNFEFELETSWYYLLCAASCGEI